MSNLHGGKVRKHSHFLFQPERLSDKIYGTRSDIWSLGISLVEVCQGKFPFEWKTVFDQLQALVQGDPPFMTADFYSMRLCDFVNQW